MRIKKTSQYIEDGANLSNVYGTSNENGYTQSYINNLQTYSSTEQRIGTWINEKPLYRQTINFGALPNNTTKSANIVGGSGSLKITDVNARIVGKSASAFSNYAPMLPYYDSGNGNYIRVTFSEYVVRISCNYNASEFDAVVDVYYWKTTD